MINSKIFVNPLPPRKIAEKKIAEKICYLRRNAFADGPFNVSLVVEVVPEILLATMPKISYHKKPRNLFLVSL